MYFEGFEWIKWCFDGRKSVINVYNSENGNFSVFMKFFDWDGRIMFSMIDNNV